MYEVNRVKMSQITSAGSHERNWSSFDFIHTNNRNRLRLACATVKDIVKCIAI